MASKPSNPKEKKDKPAKGEKPVAKKKAPTPTAKPVKTPVKAKTKAIPTPAPKRTSAGLSKAEAAHKLELFKTAYLTNGGNKTQAAITAGYSPKTAASAGNRLFRCVDVKETIAKAHQELAQEMGLDLKRTLREIARIGYGDVRKLYNPDGTLKKINELDDDTAAMVAGVEVDTTTIGGNIFASTAKVKTWDKRAALDMAMKFHGAYEQDNKQRQPITMQVAPVDEDL